MQKKINNVLNIIMGSFTGAFPILFFRIKRGNLSK